jgi:hypothetical protein
MDVTTLIPAYKTKYLVDLLTGLRVQTLPVQRIIISDDSPGGEFSAALMSAEMARYRGGLPIEVYSGPRAGAYQNFQHLVKLWGGSSEFVHLLLDDDVLYPDFFERHSAAHAEGDFSCSISARWTSNERGQPIEGMPIPDSVWGDPRRLVPMDAAAMFTSTVPQCQNWLGEFSNCIFRRENAALLLNPQFAGVSYAGLWDLGFFLAASLAAPVAYIQERLGAFRAGGGNSADLQGKHMKAAHLGYVALALGANRLGQLQLDQVRKCYLGIAAALAERYEHQDDMQPFIPLLRLMSRPPTLSEELAQQAEQVFILRWQEFLSHHQL